MVSKNLDENGTECVNRILNILVLFSIQNKHVARMKRGWT